MVNIFPDATLFIYYLEGRIAKDKQIVNQNYLGTWEEDGFSFLFFLKPAPETLSEILHNNPGLTLIDTYEMTYSQWQGGALEPKQIGSFLIVPPWFTMPEGEPSTSLILDPGLVFGNGLHPTTRDCLMALDIACSGGKVNTMLDLGCGTGILSLAGGARGCKKVIALDCNYLACQTTRKNISLNTMQDRVMVLQGDAPSFTTIPTDLLIANIHYDVMKKIIHSPGFLNQKWFILSGLLTSEMKKIREELAPLPVTLLKHFNTGSIWHTFLGITQC